MNCLRILSFLFLATIWTGSALGQSTDSVTHTVSVSLESPAPTCTVTSSGSFNYGTITWPDRTSNSQSVSASVVGTGVSSATIYMRTIITYPSNGSASISINPSATCIRGQYPPICLACAPPCTRRASADGRVTATIYMRSGVVLGTSNWPRTYPAGTYTGSVSVTGTCS